MGQRRAIDLAVVTLTALAVLLYLAVDVPWLDHTLYLGVFVLAAATAWAGAARAPADHRLVGRLIAGGITLTAVGDSTWAALDAMGLGTDVSLADPPWVASYVLLCIALSVVLRRSGAGRHDLDFTIEYHRLGAIRGAFTTRATGARSRSPSARTSPSSFS